MNLIRKRPEDYTIDEITHSKTYSSCMRNKIIDDDSAFEFSKVTSKDLLNKYKNASLVELFNSNND